LGILIDNNNLFLQLILKVITVLILSTDFPSSGVNFECFYMKQLPIDLRSYCEKYFLGIDLLPSPYG
jgi:hypothetical protein